MAMGKFGEIWISDSCTHYGEPLCSPPLFKIITFKPKCNLQVPCIQPKKKEKNQCFFCFCVKPVNNLVPKEIMILDFYEAAATAGMFVQSTAIFPMCLIWRVHLLFQLRGLAIIPFNNIWELLSPVASYHSSAINIIWNVCLLFQMWRPCHTTHQIRLSIRPSSPSGIISISISIS